jgi:hypothetical protein
MYAATMTSTTAEKPVEKPLDLTLVQRATDPKEKLRRVAELIETAETQMEIHRLRRNAAAVVLYRRTNAEAAAEGLPSTSWPMQPAEMWRDTMRVSRSLWHKVADEADPARLGELHEELAALRGEIDELPDERAAELGRLIRERDKLARKLARHQVQVQAIDELQAELAVDPGLDLLAIARAESAEVRRLEALLVEAKPIRDQLAHDLMNGAYREEFGVQLSNAEAMRLSRLSSARTAQLRSLR